MRRRAKALKGTLSFAAKNARVSPFVKSESLVQYLEFQVSGVPWGLRR